MGLGSWGIEVTKARAPDTSFHQPTSAGCQDHFHSAAPPLPREAEAVTRRRRRQTMTPPGQLLPLSRLPPGLSSRRRRSRCPPPAHAQARVSLLHPWAHRLHGRFMPSPQLFRSPACPPRAPTPPGVSAAAGGEAQAAAVAEFVTSERVKVAAMLGLALALCNADRVVMSVAIVPLSQAYGWTPSFAGVVQVPSFL
jgi:hypothetical protein